MSKKEFLDIVFTNKNYFGKVYDKLSNNHFITWNWAAFFFGYLWLAYRRAIWESVMWFSINLFANFCFITYLSKSSLWGKLLLNLSFSLFLGMFGNLIYAMSLKGKKIKNKISIGPSELDVLKVLIGVWVILGGVMSFKDKETRYQYFEELISFNLKDRNHV